MGGTTRIPLVGIVLLVAALSAAGCSGGSDTTLVLLATATPTPTASPAPTATPTPTAAPTATPTPPPLTSVPAGSTISVSAAATDPDGNPLTFQWAATDGQVAASDTSSTEWTLPSGQGLHFISVLVSNTQGGYAENRLAVFTTDPNATSPGIVKGVPLPVAPIPPTSGLPSTGTLRGWVDDFRPDLPLWLVDSSNKVAASTTSNLDGEYVFNGVVPGTYSLDVFDDLLRMMRPAQGSILRSPVSVFTFAISEYPDRTEVAPSTLDRTDNAIISGQVHLADHSLCGVREPFFGVESSATVQLTKLPPDSSPVTKSVRVNSFGHYEIDATISSSTPPGTYRIQVNCDKAPPQYQDINLSLPAVGTGRVYRGHDFTINAKAPVVNGFSAFLDGRAIHVTSLPAPLLPSDTVPAANHFLTIKGVDLKLSACQYYRTIGAVQSCDSSGNPIGGINFDLWKKLSGLAPYNSSPETTALFVNKVDLNLTRDHHGISYSANQAAMYVCNYPGVADQSNSTIDAAIDTALSNHNLVACVAMDYGVVPGVNANKPFTRFFTFGPSGNLLLSINLDGRGEKFMPGTCVACHGGDNYAGRYTDGAAPTVADIGAHFLPFDVHNFAFSDHSGLRQADQVSKIRDLNALILATNPTHAAKDLIGCSSRSAPCTGDGGWYPSQTDDNQNDGYIEPHWTGKGTPTQMMYSSVVKNSCRTCHVGMPFDLRSPIAFSFVLKYLCGGSHYLPFNHTMPNAKGPFDQLWSNAGEISALDDFVATFVSSGCDLAAPDPTDFPFLSGSSFNEGGK